MASFELILASEADSEKLAKALAAQAITGSVWLSGDLGAGKTTLTRYWLRALGVTGAIKSPTYTIVEPYQVGNRQIYHADLYRLNDPEELDLMGFFDYFDAPDTLVIIEWASRADSRLPAPDMCIDMVRLADDKRKLSMTGAALDGLTL